MGKLFCKKKKKPEPPPQPKVPILSILAIGNSVVGKTALVHCYEKMVEKEQGKEEKKDPTLSEQASMKTVATDFVIVDITVKGEKNEDVPVKVKIWDSPGQERFESLVLNAIKNTQGIFLVYDITVKQSFADLNNWIGRVKECKSISDFPFIIIANKIDLEDKREVATDEGKKFAAENHLPYFETSAITGQGVNDAFISLIQRVYNKNNNIKNNNIVL